jgi:SHS2 domain-containing protein
MCARLAAGYEEVEHTADLQLHIWGPDLLSLCEQAAHGVQQLLQACRVATPIAIHESLAVAAADSAALLVTWLNELLYLHEMRQARFFRFELRLTAEGLAADLIGEAGWAAQRSIKAATYHNLAITPRPSGGYEAVITFDV